MGSIVGESAVLNNPADFFYLLEKFVELLALQPAFTAKGIEYLEAESESAFSTTLHGFRYYFHNQTSRRSILSYCQGLFLLGALLIFPLPRVLVSDQKSGVVGAVKPLLVNRGQRYSLDFSRLLSLAHIQSDNNVLDILIDGGSSHIGKCDESLDNFALQTNVFEPVGIHPDSEGGDGGLQDVEVVVANEGKPHVFQERGVEEKLTEDELAGEVAEHVDLLFPAGRLNLVDIEERGLVVLAVHLANPFKCINSKKCQNLLQSLAILLTNILPHSFYIHFPYQALSLDSLILLLTMSEHETTPWLREGDRIQILFQDYSLYSQGFQTSELELRLNTTPLNCAFVIELSQRSGNGSKRFIGFNEGVVLRHLLSRKCLTYSQHFSSKGQVFLSYSPSQNYQFHIKPLYKCQTINNSKVRDGEECLLVPHSPAYEAQHVSLAVGKYEVGMSQRISIHLKKNECSTLKLVRQISEDELPLLNCLQVYQLRHSELRINLSYSSSEKREPGVETTEDQKDYCSFLMIQPEKHLNEASKLAKNSRVYLRFLGNQHYIGFNQKHELVLTPLPHECCLFNLETYNREENLLASSLLKIRHSSSGQYLSYHDKVLLSPFQAFNVWQFVARSGQQIANVILINDNHKGLAQALAQGITTRTKRKISTILNSTIHHCFTTPNVYQQFLHLRQIQVALTLHQQHLFIKVGYLPLLHSLCHKLVAQKTPSTQHREQLEENAFDDHQIIYRQSLLVLLAICKNNSENIISLLEYLPAFFEYLSMIPSTIELLYQVFGFNAKALRIMESKELYYKQRPKKALWMLVESIVGRSFSFSERIKLIKLFRGCIISSDKISFQTHEEIILEAIQERRLFDILFPILKDKHNNIVVKIDPSETVQLRELGRSKRLKGMKEVVLEQLKLMICLCRKGSRRHLQLFRSIIPEEMVQKYLSQELDPQFRVIFAQILIQIYLAEHSKSKKKSIIVITKRSHLPSSQGQAEVRSLSRPLLRNEVQLQMEDVRANVRKFLIDSRSLQEIKGHILGLIRQEVGQHNYTDEIIIYLQALQRFAELGICREEEAHQVLNFLTGNLQSLLENNVDLSPSFLAAYLGLLEFQLKLVIQSEAPQLIRLIRSQYHSDSPRSKSTSRIINLTNHHIRVIEERISRMDVAETLTLILQKSLITNNPPLFLRVSSVLQQLNHLGALFVGTVKACTIIESDQSRQLLQNLLKLSSRLYLLTTEGLFSQKQGIEVGAAKQIFLIIQETCHLLESVHSLTCVNSLAQRLCSQLGFLEYVMEFIIQKMGEFGEQSNNALFEAMFEFIELFLRDSEDNFKDNEHHLFTLRRLLELEDRGQIKLYYQLSSLEVAQKRQYHFLMENWLLTLKQSKAPRVHILLGIIVLLSCCEQEETKEEQIAQIVEVLNSKPLLLLLLTVERPDAELSFQYFKGFACREQWAFYLIVLFGLINQTLAGNLQGRVAWVWKIKELLPLRSILTLLEQTFQLQAKFGSSNTLYGFLMKQGSRQLIRIFSTLYKDDLDSEDRQTILVYLHKYCSYWTVDKVADSNDADLVSCLLEKRTASKSEEELKRLVKDYIRASSHSNKRQLSTEMINPFNSKMFLFVNVYYDFAFRLLEQMRDDVKHEEFNQSLQLSLNGGASPIEISLNRLGKELESFGEGLFRQYKQVVSQKKVCLDDQSQSWRYYKSIRMVQQMMHKEVGLVLKEEVEQEAIVVEGQQFFEKSELNFILNGYLTSHNKVQRYLYEAQLLILHSDKIILKTHPILDLQKIERCKEEAINLILQQIRQEKVQDQVFLSLANALELFLQGGFKPIEVEPQLEVASILAKVSNNKNDADHRILQAWIKAETLLLIHYFTAKPKVTAKYQQLYNPSDQKWPHHFQLTKQRLKQKIEFEKMLYGKKMVLDQARIYFDGCKLNDGVEESYRIQNILNWMALKLKFNVINSQKYLDLIVEILELLRVYVRFLESMNYKYVSSEIQHKIQLCLLIIVEACYGSNLDMMRILVNHQIWKEINSLLALDDSLSRNLQEATFSGKDLLQRLGRQLEGSAGYYTQGVLQIYNNSLGVYGEDDSIICPSKYPLLPAKAFYKGVKERCISVMRYFRQSAQLGNQFFSKIETSVMDWNIRSIYEKYQYLYNSYTIATVYTHLEYKDSTQEPIASNMSIENGVHLVALKMWMEALNGNNRLQHQYARVRDSLTTASIFSFLALFKGFFIDLFMLIFSSCLRISKKQRLGLGKEQKILGFFLEKLGKVEIVWRDKLYEYDYIIYPECRIGWKMRKDCLEELNLASNQLKRESMMLSMNRFILYYRNQLRFFGSCCRMRMFYFIGKYNNVLKMICYGLVVAENLILVTDSLLNIYLNDLDTSFPFDILALSNLCIAVLILVVFLVRDIPLVSELKKYYLQEGIGFFSKGFKDASQPYRNLIIILKTVFTLDLLYHILYTTLTALSLYNKLFASVLLLDVLAHIPALKMMLLSLWNPRYQILLTVIGFVIIQYFFSIFLYFFFRDYTHGYCSSLGNCFNFVLASTFRSINGFVGYLFQLNETLDNTNVNLTVFGIFQDLYAIMVHLIMTSVMLAVVINSFVVSQAQSAKKRESLRNACIVCNLDRPSFNLSKEQGFIRHKRINHYLFNYFECRYVLGKKEWQFLSDLQRYVVEGEHSAWIPENRSLDLNG